MAIPDAESHQPPLTIEEYDQSLAEVYFHQVRALSVITDIDTVREVFGNGREDYLSFMQLADPAAKVSDLSEPLPAYLKSEFRASMLSLYRYAYFGILEDGYGVPEGESEYVWYTTLCADAAYGATAHERSQSYSSDVDVHGMRCLEVAETANARNMLEGEEDYYSFRFPGRNEMACFSEGLTFRQVALLAGMSEGSVRAATNPKRNKPLVTFKYGNFTLVKPQVAREWLIDKGRYVPVRRVKAESAMVDWESQRIESLRQFNNMLQQQLAAVRQDLSYDQADQLMDAIEAATPGYDSARIGLLGEHPFEMKIEHLKDEAAMRKVAELLKVKEKLFLMCVREVMAIETAKSLFEQRLAFTQSK